VELELGFFDDSEIGGIRVRILKRCKSYVN
jgi:hypothetical protein